MILRELMLKTGKTKDPNRDVNQGLALEEGQKLLVVVRKIQFILPKVINYLNPIPSQSRYNLPHRGNAPVLFLCSTHLQFLSRCFCSVHHFLTPSFPFPRPSYACRCLCLYQTGRFSISTFNLERQRIASGAGGLPSTFTLFHHCFAQ